MGHKKTIWFWSLMGGVLGVGFLHPVIMILAGLMILNPEPGKADALLESVNVFSFQMLPWNLGFGILGILCGYFYAKNRLAQKAILENERLQGVLEMAGAACHEMGQPLQTILGLTEIIRDKLDSTDLANREFKLINREFDRLIEISRKIHNISRYSTSEYIDGIKIINIDDASSEAPKDFKAGPRPHQRKRHLKLISKVKH